MIDLGEFAGRRKAELAEQAESFAYQLEQAYAEPEKYAHEIQGLEDKFTGVKAQIENILPDPVEQHKEQIRAKVQFVKDEHQAAKELIEDGEIKREEIAAVSLITMSESHEAAQKLDGGADE